MVIPLVKAGYNCVAAFIFLFSLISCPAQTQPLKNSKVVAMNCENTAIEKSHALIKFILDDIKATYPHVGGGGISEIKQTQTNLFVVLIAQEERIDQLSYELTIDKNCEVSLVQKKESAINFSH